MSNDKTNNGLVSDTTSQNEPHLDARGSEVDFLDRQASDARLAISETFGELVGRLERLGDVRQWTKEYPLAAVGAAGLVGFFVASSVVSVGAGSGGKTERNDAGGEFETARSGGSSPLSSILSNVVDLAATAAVLAVRNAIVPGDPEADANSANSEEAAPH